MADHYRSFEVSVTRRDASTLGHLVNEELGPNEHVVSVTPLRVDFQVDGSTDMPGGAARVGTFLVLVQS